MSKIEWCTATKNWLGGCTEDGPECLNCYARTFTPRLVRMLQAGGHDEAAEQYVGVTKGKKWTGVIKYNPEPLGAMFAWLKRARKPQKVFCNSMSDTFHQDVPPESLDDLQRLIHEHDKWMQVQTAPAYRMSRSHSVIMLLTKRPGRLLAWQRQHFPEGLPWWVWVGTTAGDQKRVEKRVPDLQRVRVRLGGVRFVSCEPLLGPVDLFDAMARGLQVQCTGCRGAGTVHRMSAGEPGQDWCSVCGGSGASWHRIHWVIAGGESGAGARKAQVDHFRTMRDLCASADTAFFMKQMDEHAGADKRAIPLDLQVRQFPATPWG